MTGSHVQDLDSGFTLYVWICEHDSSHAYAVRPQSSVLEPWCLACPAGLRSRCRAIAVVPRAVADRLADELEHIVPAHAISAQAVLAEYRAAYPREETTP